MSDPSVLPVQLQLTLEEWQERYKPIRNRLNPTRGYEGTLFETYSADLDYVVSYLEGDKRLQIWTLLQEDGVEWITNGYHFVNRMGYFITEVPFEDGRFIEIMIDDGSDRDDEEEDNAPSSVDG